MKETAPRGPEPAAPPRFADSVVREVLRHGRRKDLIDPSGGVDILIDQRGVLASLVDGRGRPVIAAPVFCSTICEALERLWLMTVRHP
jgi:hypothetical protein